MDIYGVIVKQTGDAFVPYVQQAFPELAPEAIFEPWNRADMGELSSLEIWSSIGFQGDLEKIEDDRRGYWGAAKKVGLNTILFNSRNVPYKGDTINSFEELMKRIL